MKFRGKMVEISSIRLFAQLINILQKSSKTFVLRIMPEKLMFVLSDKNTNQSIQSAGSASAWCEIPQDPYFSEYNMEGISPQDNEIFLEIASDMMASSLSSLRSSHNVLTLKMKLTKKIVPCITFEIETQSINSRTSCTHDLPVALIPRRSWNEYQDPDLPNFNVSLAMPEIKFIRQAIERIKNLGPKLTVTMSKAGKMSFGISTYNVDCKVTFSDLRHYILENEDDMRPSTPVVNSQTEEKAFTVEVDMRSVQHLLPADGVKPSTLICSMTDERLMHWLFQYGDVTLQYALPGVSL